MIVTAMVLTGIVAIALWFAWRWRRLEHGNGAQSGPIDVAIGFITNFFDTLGISSFASTTAAFKLLKRVPDDRIPGTLNVGHAMPTFTQALIFISVVTVDPLTLVSMIAAAVTGAWTGVGIVARLPRRAIQIAMGVALLIAAALFVASLTGAMPGGGTAEGLAGGRLLLAIGVIFVLGALMMLGVGLYAPCLILVSLLGMSPLVAFPIMMGACAFLMPVGGVRFIASGRYSLPAALGLAIGGVPAVLIAAYIVKSLPLDTLRWLVIIVVTYTALSMLRSAWRERGINQQAAA